MIFSFPTNLISSREFCGAENIFGIKIESIFSERKTCFVAARSIIGTKIAREIPRCASILGPRPAGSDDSTFKDLLHPKIAQ
jgi:hypothetical protein